MIIGSAAQSLFLLKSVFHLLEFTFFYIISRKSICPQIALIWQENQSAWVIFSHPQ